MFVGTTPVSHPVFCLSLFNILLLRLCCVPLGSSTFQFLLPFFWPSSWTFLSNHPEVAAWSAFLDFPCKYVLFKGTLFLDIFCSLVSVGLVVVDVKTNSQATPTSSRGQPNSGHNCDDNATVCYLKNFTLDKSAGKWCRIFAWFYLNHIMQITAENSALQLGNHGSAELPPLLPAGPCVCHQQAPPPPANQDQRRWMRQRESGEARHWLTQTSSHSLGLQRLNLLKTW